MKIAHEPVAFHLYKSRHFEELKRDNSKDKKEDGSSDYKSQLIKLLNAKFLNYMKLNELVERALYLKRGLDYRIVNMPEDLMNKLK